MPLTRVTGQKMDALVGHANGWRGRLCFRRSCPEPGRRVKSAPAQGGFVAGRRWAAP